MDHTTHLEDADIAMLIEALEHNVSNFRTMLGVRPDDDTIRERLNQHETLILKLQRLLEDVPA